MKRMTSSDDARLEAELVRVSAGLEKVFQRERGWLFWEAFGRYFVTTYPGLSRTKLGKLLEKTAGPRTREAFVTWINELQRRGERRGRVMSLLLLLTARFGLVPPNVVKRIQIADELTIDRWTIRVLTEPTLKDVLADEGKGTARRRPATGRRITGKRAARTPGARRAS